MLRTMTREIRLGDSGSGTDFLGLTGNVLQSLSFRARQVFSDLSELFILWRGEMPSSLRSFS